MKLYILRHGETDWNIVRRLQGQTDISLNEKGKRFAVETGKGMKAAGLNFDEIYTSPLDRAVETQKLVIQNLYDDGADVPAAITDNRIMEISFGELEGQSAYDPAHMMDDPDHFYFIKKPEAYKVPEKGESFEELEERIGSFLRDLAKRGEEDKKILISTHGCASRAFLAVIGHTPIENFWGPGVPPNCAVSIVSFENGAWKLDERDHLYY